MTDETEEYRVHLLDNGIPEKVCAKAEKKWSTDELIEEFVVHSFLAPFVTVTRRSDGVLGSMMFTHSPRWYFDFQPAETD